MSIRRLIGTLSVLASALALTYVHTADAAKQPAVVVPSGWPKFVTITKIHVHASIEPLAFARASDYHAPYRWGDVAWYSRGPRPGEAGHAVIYGHLDSTCCPAVFYLLRTLKRGDRVQVTYKNGRSLTFVVMWQATWANNAVPVKYIYGRDSQHGMMLMTCSGVFHRDGTGYDHKLGVYARLLLPNGQLG